MLKCMLRRSLPNVWHGLTLRAWRFSVQELLQAVRSFTLPPSAAAAHMSAVHQLSAARGDVAWAAVLQRDSEEHLGRYVDAASKGTMAGDAAKAEWQACTAAFTAGEASRPHV